VFHKSLRRGRWRVGNLAIDKLIAWIGALGRRLDRR
jgi:hypothetical protein